MAKFKPWKFDPIAELGVDVPKSKRKEALAAAAEYLREAMLDYIGEAKSPVSGGEWVRGLTPAYKKKKGEESSATFANLELSGDLLDSFVVEPVGKNLVVDVGSDQYGKAEGHITGEYGANAKNIRKRQFAPQGGERLKREILSNLKSILEEYEDGED